MGLTRESAADSYLAAVVRASGDAIIGLSPDGCVESWNPAAEQLFGYTLEEALGQPIALLTRLEQQAEQALLSARAGQATRLETVCVAKDERRVNVILASAAVMDAAGQVGGIVATFTDITAQKQTEAALVQKSAHLQLLVDVAAQLRMTDDVDQFVDGSYRQLTALMELDGYFHYRTVEDKPGLLQLATYHGVDAETAARMKRLRYGEVVCGMVAQARTPVVLESVQQTTDPQSELIRALGITAYACYPLQTQSGVYGTVSFARRAQPRFTPDELSLLRAVCDLVAIAIEHTRAAALEQANAAIQAEIAERRMAEEQTRSVLRQLVTAQEDERRHIARKLHDQLGQTISALHFGLAALSSAPQWPSSLTERITGVQQLVAQLSIDLDHLALELRPSTLDHLGLAAALEQHVRTWAAQTNTTAEFEDIRSAHSNIPADIATVLYRVAQEALTNVRKHAHARHASVILDQHATSVSVIVEDDGIGFAVETIQQAPEIQRRLGLLGMQERVALAGGTLTIESAPGKGTTVLVRVPLPSTVEAANPAP